MTLLLSVSMLMILGVAMTLLPGLDQLGNRKFKSGTKSTRTVRRRWKRAGRIRGTLPLATVMDNFGDAIKRLGNEARFVCDDLEIDWGIQDDPTDEEIILIVTFNSEGMVDTDGVSTAIANAELVSVQQWRAGVSLFAVETTPGVLRLADDQILEKEIDEFHFQNRGSANSAVEAGIDFIVAVTSSTTSSIIVLFKASGFMEYKLPQRAQPVFEWQGYLMEEIDDCDSEDENDA